MEQRLAISSKESLLMPEYDYLIVNDVLEDAVKEVHRIIMSTHYATIHNTGTIRDMQQQLLAFAVGEEPKGDTE